MNSKFTLIEVMICVAIFGILAVVFVVPVATKIVGWDSEYSSGERTGVVTKISKKGFIFKTWEGEMNLGGIGTDGGGSAVPNLWRFSVTDESVVKQVTAAAATGGKTTLTYTELYKTTFKQGETDYLILSVRR